jgi:crotonobetainyl-CoA:carnitine CoA-transferase CaiB-like acyl-CoA transferase
MAPEFIPQNQTSRHEDFPPAPLQGVRVVELAAPIGEWAGRLLAGLGADVVKIEPLGGASSRFIGPFVDDEPDPQGSLYFWHFNSGKRSVELDAGTDKGRDAFHRLVAAADILIETLPPAGSPEATQRRYEGFAKDNPKLVEVAISPFGQDGPYVDAHLQTTDLVTMALGGILQSCGYDAEFEQPPMLPDHFHSYYAAGHYAVIAAMVALWEREASGVGQFIDVSAQACLAVTNEGANLQYEYLGNVVRRQTARHAGPVKTVPGQLLCADGRYINTMMLPRDPATWRRLVAFLKEHGLGENFTDDEMLTDPARRMERSAYAVADLEVVAASMTSEEMFHTGQAIGMTWGAVRAPEDWLDDPHAEERGFFVPSRQPMLEHDVPMPRGAIAFGATPMRAGRAPFLGEHTTEVLKELEA